MDPRLLSNAPPELLRSHSFQPAAQSVFYPPVLGPPKYAWSPRLPSRSQLPESRMFSDSTRMYPVHPYFGSRDVQQYPLSDYLPPHHGRDVIGGHDVIGGPPSHHLGTSHSSPQLAQVSEKRFNNKEIVWQISFRFLICLNKNCYFFIVSSVKTSF